MVPLKHKSNFVFSLLKDFRGLALFISETLHLCPTDQIQLAEFFFFFFSLTVKQMNKQTNLQSTVKYWKVAYEDPYFYIAVIC